MNTGGRADLELQVQVNQRMLEAMATLEKRHEKLLTHLREMVFIAQADGTLLYVNPAWQRNMGCAPERCLGQRLQSFVALESEARASRILAETNSVSGEASEVELLSLDGRRTWAELLVSRIPEENLLLGLMVDVSARKESDQRLRDSEERLNFVMEATGEGVWDWLLDRGVVRHNMRWCALLKLDDSHLEHSMDVFVSKVHPEDREVVLQRVQRCLSGQEPYVSEHRMLCADGSVIWVHDRGDVVSRDDAGRPLRMVGSFSDVTERKRVQDALATSEGLLRKIMANMPEGVLAISALGNVTFCNDKMADMLHLERDAEGRVGTVAFLERLGASINLERTQGLIEAIRQGALEGVIEFKSPERVIKWETRELEGSDDLRHLYFFRDITRETEVDRMKSEFLATAAHELRTPMASVYGFVELLLNREVVPEARREYLGIVYEQTKSLIKMLNELLDLARIEARAGKDFKLELHDALEVARRALQELNMLPDKREVRIESPADGVAQVWIDQDKVKQVFTNVFSNAYKRGFNFEVQRLT